MTNTQNDEATEQPSLGWLHDLSDELLTAAGFDPADSSEQTRQLAIDIVLDDLTGTIRKKLRAGHTPEVVAEYVDDPETTGKLISRLVPSLRHGQILGDMDEAAPDPFDDENTVPIRVHVWGHAGLLLYAAGTFIDNESDPSNLYGDMFASMAEVNKRESVHDAYLEAPVAGIITVLDEMRRAAKLLTYMPHAVLIEKLDENVALIEETLAAHGWENSIDPFDDKNKTTIEVNDWSRPGFVIEEAAAQLGFGHPLTMPLFRMALRIEEIDDARDDLDSTWVDAPRRALPLIYSALLKIVVVFTPEDENKVLTQHVASVLARAKDLLLTLEKVLVDNRMSYVDLEPSVPLD